MRVRVYHNILLHFTAGSDYESMTFSLIFVSTDEGENVLCADVPILNDRLGNEPDEAFSVSIINISPAGQVGSMSEACVFIIDDDGMHINYHFYLIDWLFFIQRVARVPYVLIIPTFPSQVMLGL